MRVSLRNFALAVGLSALAVVVLVLFRPHRDGTESRSALLELSETESLQGESSERGLKERTPGEADGGNLTGSSSSASLMRERAVPPLCIRLEEGDQLAFNVSREHERTGRLEGGDSTEIDYALQVGPSLDTAAHESVALELEVLLTRIRFSRTGRAPMAFDTAVKKEGEAVLAATLRDLVDKPLRVRVDAQGKVGEVRGFAEPKLPSHVSRGGAEGNGANLPESERLRGLQAEARFQRVASLMLRTVVSPEVVRQDLQAIFASGLQGRQLRRGEVYAVDVPERRSVSRGRRLVHPGAAPIRGSEGQVPSPNPLSGGGDRGRGTYALQLSGQRPQRRAEVYHFDLVRSSGRQDAEPAGDAPRVGVATYRKSDGLLEKLAYRYEIGNDGSRDRALLSWNVDITRRR